MSHTKLLYFYIFFWIIESIIAQTTYITDSTYFQRISSFYFLQDKSIDSYSYIDTSIINFQNSLPFYFNGQIGTAQPDYLLQDPNIEIGARVWNIYYPDILTKENFNIYRTKDIYAQLEGMAGSKEEQHFRAFFTSPVQDKHQINFYLRRSTNIGFYQNQKASITNLFADYHLYGKRRVFMDGNILLNFIKHQENGGIVADTLSYHDLSVNKILIPISLSDAKKNIQSNEINYHIHFLLNKDTVNLQAMSLSAAAQKKLFHYQDNYPLSGYYPFIFMDTLKTNDSLHSLEINLPIAYTFKIKKNIFQISYNYEWNKIHLFSDTIMQNHYVNGKYQSTFNIFGKIKTTLGKQFKYIIYGTQKNNYLLSILVKMQYKSYTLSTVVDIARQSPTFQQNYWYSNHYTWYNHFKDILTQKFSFDLDYLSFLKLSYNLLFAKNYIYFFENYPQQYKNTLIVHQFRVNLNKIFFRHVGLKVTYYYQWKNANVITFPEHFLISDVYYQGRWFHKNLLVNTGMQYVSAINYFDTYQYNPATGVYSITMNSFQAGNYPQIGIYFSGRIKPVNFFIRFDNILSGIYQRAYYYIPHYMMPDRMFRVGISWMFFD